MAIQINTLYLRSPPGILKILEVIFSFMAMLMYLIYDGKKNAIGLNFFFIATLVALIVTFALLLFYVFGISEILGPFMNLQTYFHLIWMFVVLAYSSILLYVDSSTYDRVSAGIFGMLLAVAYLLDALHGFVKYPPMPF